MNLRHFGLRDTRCAGCKMLLRREDINKRGICVWCQWEMDEASVVKRADSIQPAKQAALCSPVSLLG